MIRHQKVIAYRPRVRLFPRFRQEVVNVMIRQPRGTFCCVNRQENDRRLIRVVQHPRTRILAAFTGHAEECWGPHKLASDDGRVFTIERLRPCFIREQPYPKNPWEKN